MPYINMKEPIRYLGMQKELPGKSPIESNH